MLYVFFGIPKKVYAESIYQDGYAYRQVSEPVYNNETDRYEITYRIYNASAKHEGVASIPSNIYNKNQWILLLNANNQLVIYNFYKWDVGSYYFRLVDNHYNLTRGTDVTNARNDQWTIYTYNSSTDTWTSSVPPNNNIISYNKEDINPNAVIYAKGVGLNYYIDGTRNKGYSTLRSNRVLEVPVLKLLPDWGFRLYLNDFYTQVYENDTYYETLALTSVQCIVYDYNQQSYVTQDSDILASYEVEGDAENGYYIDIPFSEYFTYMNTLDGDYLIAFAPYLNDVIHYEVYGNSTAFDFQSVYYSLDYARYVYYSDLGVGILRQVNDDGSLKEGEAAIPTTEELAEQLAREEEERKEREKEQARLDAINGVTNAVEEQTEVQRNIFQSILDLPRSNY